MKLIVLLKSLQNKPISWVQFILNIFLDYRYVCNVLKNF